MEAMSIKNGMDQAIINENCSLYRIHIGAHKLIHKYTT